MNAIEILLGILSYIKGSLVADSKVIDISSYGDECWIELELSNKDIIKIRANYKPKQESEKEDEND